MNYNLIIENLIEPILQERHLNTCRIIYYMAPHAHYIYKNLNTRKFTWGRK